MIIGLLLACAPSNVLLDPKTCVEERCDPRIVPNIYDGSFSLDADYEPIYDRAIAQGDIDAAEQAACEQARIRLAEYACDANKGLMAPLKLVAYSTASAWWLGRSGMSQAEITLDLARISQVYAGRCRQLGFVE